MPSSLTEIREALKTTLAQFGLQVYSTVPDVANTPACVVEPSIKDSIVFTGAMRMGGDTYNFDLSILVAATDVRNAQQILDQYITGQGPKSIRELLFHNVSLGLDDVNCVPVGVREYGGTPQVEGIKMIGAIMRVRVTVD